LHLSNISFNESAQHQVDPTEGEYPMATVEFERDLLAESYANRHWRTDDSIDAILYLPAGAPEHEIWLLVVNRR